MAYVPTWWSIPTRLKQKGAVKNDANDKGRNRNIRITACCMV